MSKELFIELIWLCIMVYVAYTCVKQSIKSWKMKDSAKAELESFEEDVRQYKEEFEEKKAMLKRQGGTYLKRIEQSLAKLTDGSIRRTFKTLTALLMFDIVLAVAFALMMAVTILMMLGVPVMEYEDRQLTVAAIFIIQLAVAAMLRKQVNTIDKKLVQSASLMVVIDFVLEGAECEFGLPLEKSRPRPDKVLH